MRAGTSVLSFVYTREHKLTASECACSRSGPCTNDDNNYNDTTTRMTTITSYYHAPRLRFTDRVLVWKMGIRRGGEINTGGSSEEFN